MVLYNSVEQFLDTPMFKIWKIRFKRPEAAEDPPAVTKMAAGRGNI